MLNSKVIAIFIAGLLTVVALAVLVDRRGLIAWVCLFAGVALLGKIRLKPSGIDLGLSVGLATVSVLAWAGTLYYVISTYESGEVVELAIDTDIGTQTVRLWVLEMGADPVVYYDAEPAAAASLLAGTPVQFTRGDEVSTRIPRAALADELPEDEANLVFEAMERKYGDRLTAADVSYLVLGRARDRVAVVARLTKE